MAESLEQCLDDFFSSGMTKFDLERDYILNSFKIASSQNEAARVLDRDKNGLIRRMKRFDSKTLRHPGLKPQLTFCYNERIDLTELLTNYCHRVSGKFKNHKSQSAEFLDIGRDYLAKILRQTCKGKFTYNTEFIRGVIDKIYGLSLEDLRKKYVWAAMEVTSDNINKTLRVTGIAKKTIKKYGKQEVSYQKHFEVLSMCFKKAVTFAELEKWYIASLVSEAAEKLDISTKSFKNKVNEYARERYNKK